jgi:hypothetical protein
MQNGGENTTGLYLIRMLTSTVTQLMRENSPIIGVRG